MLNLPELPSDEYLEAPLEGLVQGKAMDEMSDEELRANVQKFHEYRVNSQALYGAIRRSSKSEQPAVKAAERSLFDSIGEENEENEFNNKKEQQNEKNT